MSCSWGVSFDTTDTTLQLICVGGCRRSGGDGGAGGVEAMAFLAEAVPIAAVDQPATGRQLHLSFRGCNRRVELDGACDRTKGYRSFVIVKRTSDTNYL